MTTQPPGHRVRFDFSARSTLARCECGWRDIAATRTAAAAMAAEHQQRMDRRRDWWLRYLGPKEHQR